VPGLEILPGEVVPSFSRGNAAADGSRLKVPHMGWNRVHQARSPPLWAGHAEDDARFYFVHSYYVEPRDPGLIAGLDRLRHPLYQRGCAR
jgi:glutamine amidotransferase